MKTTRPAGLARFSITFTMSELRRMADLFAETAASCADESENAKWTRMLTHVRGVIGRLRMLGYR